MSNGDRAEENEVSDARAIRVPRPTLFRRWISQNLAEAANSLALLQRATIAQVCKLVYMPEDLLWPKRPAWPPDSHMRACLQTCLLSGCALFCLAAVYNCRRDPSETRSPSGIAARLVRILRRHKFANMLTCLTTRFRSMLSLDVCMRNFLLVNMFTRLLRIFFAHLRSLLVCNLVCMST
jgi:hypothetical protein